MVRLTRTSLVQTVAFLCEQDPDLAQIHTRYGSPPLWARTPGFATLVHIILEQQVSLASAQAAFNRLKEAILLTPDNFLTLGDAELKAIGFSRQKARYVRLLSQAVLEGFDLRKLEQLDDTEAKVRLMRLKGIGHWTAEIYLLMALRRPDVWPSGDLALQLAVQKLKGLAQRPDSAELVRIAKPWRPFRAVAARMLWHLYLSERRVRERGIKNEAVS